MMDIELLKRVSELDEKKAGPNSRELVDNLDMLEQAHSKLHSLVITARMNKIMNDFGQRETDIYVVSFPRSGTTLMQMILYQLTTNGDMDFGHVYDISPWCRFSAFFKRPMASVGERRIIKSHDPYSMLATLKKGKFVFLIRDCLDVIPSIYQQTINYVDPSVDFDQLSSRNMKNWFDYNTEWIENKNHLPVLYVHYEDLINDKEEMIFRISDFLDIQTNDEIIDRTLTRTSFDFMKNHEVKFGEQPEHWKVYNNFIRNGRVGEGKQRFTEEQLGEYRNLLTQYNVNGTSLQRYFE